MTYVASYDALTDAEERSATIKLHGPEGFAGMRAAGRLAAEVLDMLVPHVVPDVVTADLDRLAYDYVLARGAIPATIFYRGYAHSLCISVNHVVCHGMPSAKRLRDGDIVNIDVTVIVDGWHGDTSRMFLVGDVPLKARRLVDITWECLQRGIAAAKARQHARRHPATQSRAMRRRSAARWSAISAGTGWGACSTMRPTSCTSAGRAPATCSSPA